ncbi:uracil-DNA glycosylase [Ileibacterium valens]|uniref:uracil-DNA glycosylase n=1 Tax=Ileibacterium valens TaxID=1862668 RepID=UPI00272B3F5D|nr:uracil-DNA glycosylase [Ileibacterium valens]
MSIQNWEQLIEQEEAKGTFDTLRPYLDQAYKEQIIYPAKENIFRALEMTPLDKVRVVILGQDPYHGPNQAQGFSFSVPANEKIPPSLRNIYQEIFNEYQTPVQRSGDLSDWASQGVLLLNSILTVEQGKPMSHSNLGWQNFTDDILRVLNEQNQPIVFMLWGAQARKAKRFLNNPNHLILESVHPSPLSANRGFFNSGQFKKANEFLESKGEPPIDWAKSNLTN